MTKHRNRSKTRDAAVWSGRRRQPPGTSITPEQAAMVDWESAL